MRNLAKLFENKKIDIKKLLDYGFTQDDNNFTYEKTICDNRFKVIIKINEDKQISKVIDEKLGDEYNLVDVSGLSGDYVGHVKEEYELVLDDIISSCTHKDVFKSNQAKSIMNYVQEKYQNDLEFLWKKFPTNAIYRNKENNKWYAVLAVLSEEKLGIDSEKIVDVIILKYQSEYINEVIDNEIIFAGYHMNKSNWITLKLDGSLDDEKIKALLDNSYELSLKKKK